MKKAGLTLDGKTVVSEVFKFVGTHGIPLEQVLSYLQENNLVMDWVAYIKDALAEGHNPTTIRARIESAVGEIYGPNYRKEITKRLELLEL